MYCIRENSFNSKECADIDKFHIKQQLSKLEMTGFFKCMYACFYVGTYQYPFRNKTSLYVVLSLTHVIL